MLKKLPMSLLAVILAVFLLASVSLQAYDQFESQALATYFTRIGVITEAHHLDTAVDWDLFETLFVSSLPGHQIAEDLTWDDALDYPQIAAQLIKAVNQEEFVYTYHDLDSKSDQFIAAAEIIGFDLYPDVTADPELEIVLRMLLKARVDTNIYTPYLGHISDQDIYRLSRIKRETISQPEFVESVPELFELGVKAISNIPGGTFTGYNIKNYNENPIFNPELKMRYDHGSMGHLLQMASLLRREDFDVRWDVKGRISSYVHHVDQWGEPDPDSVLAEIDETRVVVGSASYDILLEFASHDELAEFKTMIDEFARRKEEDTFGLIASPYYAPVFGSITELPGYEEVIGLRVNHGHYYLQSYVLVDYADQVIAEMEGFIAEMPGEFTIETATYYVNPEFVNYLINNLTD